MTNDFSELIEYLDVKFLGIDQRFLGIDRRFEQIDQRFINLEQKFDQKLDEKISQLPTKAYLDDKLSDLEGRFNLKFNRLTDILQNKKILNKSDTTKIYSH